MTTDKPAIEFVNDWEPLERAVALLKENADDQGSYYAQPWVQSSEAEWVFSVFVEFVPRLLTQYASLLELSFALTEGWDQYAAHTPPTGLYLPEHR